MLPTYYRSAGTIRGGARFLNNNIFRISTHRDTICAPGQIAFGIYPLRHNAAGVLKTGRSRPGLSFHFSPDRNCAIGAVADHLQTGGPVSKVPDLDPLLPPRIVSPGIDSIDNNRRIITAITGRVVESNDGTAAAIANHLFKITAILRPDNAAVRIDFSDVFYTLKLVRRQIRPGDDCASSPIADNIKNGEAVRIGLSAANERSGNSPERFSVRADSLRIKFPVSPTLYFFINDDSAAGPVTDQFRRVTRIRMTK